MFIELSTRIVNTVAVESFTKGKLWFIGAPEENLILTEEDYKKLCEVVLDNEEEVVIGEPVQHKPSETGVFLNQLHKLLGGKGEAKLTTDRKARLATRMKDFTKEEMIAAATNLGNDEFMQGANDNGKRYGTIDYLLRTSANVNKYLEETIQKKKGMFN